MLPLNNEDVLRNVDKGLAGKNLLLSLDYDRRQIDIFLKEYGFKTEEQLLTSLSKDPSKMTNLNENSSKNILNMKGEPQMGPILASGHSDQNQNSILTFDMASNFYNTSEPRRGNLRRNKFGNNSSMGVHG